MKVRVNSSSQILKSFISWLPILLISAVMYGGIFSALAMMALTHIFGMDLDSARPYGLITGGLLLVISVYFYISWITKSLASYRLEVEDDSIIVKGISGWSSLNKSVPISAIEKIYLGVSANTIEKLSSGHGAVNDQIASRLTFFPSAGKSFKLDFSTKAFDNESLCEFLVAIKDKGIDTNVSNV